MEHKQEGYVHTDAEYHKHLPSSSYQLKASWHYNIAAGTLLSHIAETSAIIEIYTDKTYEKNCGKGYQFRSVMKSSPHFPASQLGLITVINMIMNVQSLNAFPVANITEA